jgi:hypothetical protein
VDRHRPTRRSPAARRKDRRASRDVGDHLGWIKELSAGWTRSHLAGFEFDEVFHTAILEADRILRTKFDPDRSTASTYLSKYLLGFVHYRMIKSTGRRKTADGWVEPSPHDRPGPRDAEDPRELAELGELLDLLHPDIRPTAMRLAEGDSLEQIAEEEVSRFHNRRGRREAIQVRVEELRSILRGELESLLDE